MSRSRAICHPAYLTQPDAASGAEHEPFDGTIVASCIGLPAGEHTSFTRAERDSASGEHTHALTNGSTITHSHLLAGAVHAHTNSATNRY